MRNPFFIIIKALTQAPTRLKIAFLSFIFQCASITPAHGALTDQQLDKIIYGTDNRFESADFHDALFREKAKSVAAMVLTNKLVNTGEEFVFFKRAVSDSRNINLCKDERFSDQPTLSICSGFLIADDLLVTAGHCMDSQQMCDAFSWVFEYENDSETFLENQVYGCSEIIAHQEVSTLLNFKDYAIIRLDRKVENRRPLEYRKRGRPNWGENLVTIGHPMGLPQKISNGAEVKFGNIFKDMFKAPSDILGNHLRKANFFLANIDAFGGNSGSPVFNSTTGLVEGILTEGAEDFVESEDEFGQCNKSATRSNSTFVADEKVYRINRIDELDQLL